MTMYFTASELAALSQEAGLTIEQLVAVVVVLEAHQAKAEAARRVTDEEKEAITAYVTTFMEDGGEIGNVTVNDLLARVGVREVQGTRSFVKAELHRAQQRRNGEPL